MIIGVGLDLVSISRIKSLLENNLEKFESRIFTASEIEISKKFANIELKSRYYAKRFAAKEAFSKAAGLGIGRGINFNDIGVANDKNGKPEIQISDQIYNFLKHHFKNNDFKIDLSLTDEQDLAQAMVIISKKC